MFRSLISSFLILGISTLVYCIPAPPQSDIDRSQIIDSLITVGEYQAAFDQCVIALESVADTESLFYRLKAAQSQCYRDDTIRAKYYLDQVKNLPQAYFALKNAKALQLHTQALVDMTCEKDSLAEVHFTRAEEELANCCTDQPELWGDLYYDWAQLLEKTGDNKQATLKSEAALQYRESSSNKLKIIQSLIQVAKILYWEIADVERAYEYVSQAEKLWSQDDGFPIALWIDGQLLLAAIYNAFDDWEECNAVLIKSLNRLTKDEESFQDVISYILMGIGVNYLETSDPRAYEYLMRAVRTQLSLPPSERGYLDIVYEKLGVYFRIEGQLDSALYYLNLALKNYKVTESPRLSDVYQELATTFLVAGNPEKALKAINNALEVIDSIDILELDPRGLSATNIDNFYNPMELNGRIYLELYLRNQQISNLEEALKVFQWIERLAEESRSGSYSEETKLVVSEHFFRAASYALQVLQELYDQHSDTAYLNLAFNFMEHNRYASLFRNLTKIKSMSDQVIPDTIVERENAFLSEMEVLQSQIEQESSGIDSLQERLLQLDRAYQAFRDRVERQFPLFYQVEYDSLLTLSQIQARLPKGCQLVEFFWSDTLIHILSVSKNKIVMTTKAHREFAQIIERFLPWLADPFSDRYQLNFDQFQDMSYRLYQHLLEPFLEQETRKLVLSPDGPLAYLPFDVLVIDTNSTSFSDAKYVVREYQIQYAFSSNLHFATAHRTPLESPCLLAMSYSAIESNVLSPGNQTKALRFSSKEVDIIRKKLRQIDVEVLKGRDAGKEQFVNLVQNFNMLHLAIHGLADPESRRGSYLLFNHPDDPAKGRLYAQELYNLELEQLRLVVLSACESGIGKSEPGEGMFSIARAFFRHHVGSMVISLWKADDQSTADLMEQFYDELSLGRPVGEAVRQAKIHYLANSPNTLSVPYYWAGFIPIGQDAVLISDSFPQWKMIIYLLFFSIIYFVYRWKLKKKP